MKKGFIKKVGAIAVALAAVSMCGTSVAQATVWMPSPGPLYIKYDNREQLSASGSILAPSGALESNWGIFKVSAVHVGDTSTEAQLFDPGTQVWTDSMPGGEITGIFAGIQLNGADPSPGFNSKGGSLYLYWDDAENANLAAATLGQRTGDFTFTNFTDGTLLAKIDFVPGAVTANPLTTVNGTAVPTSGGFAGLANSYGNVDVAAGGLWASIMDSSYFTTLLGPNTADVHFRTIYNGPLNAWNGAGGDIVGAQSSDPARAYVVPEPSTMLLLGMGLVGAGLMARRRKA